MRIKLAAILGATFVCVGVMAGSAMAAEKTAGPDKPAAADKKPLQVDITAGKVLNTLARTYRSMKTFQEDIEIATLTNLPYGDQGTSTGSLQFAQPNRMHFAMPGMRIICDGKRLCVMLEELSQYKLVDVPPGKPLPSDILASTMPMRYSDVTSTMGVLFADDVPAALAGDATSITLGASTEYADTHTVVQVHGEDISRELFINAKRNLIEQVVIDISPSVAYLQAQMGMEEKPSLKFRVDHRNIVVNEPVDDKTFAINPPKDYLKVEEFGPRAEMFSGKTLGGGKVDMSGLRGKVVLLTFWATWCQPCRMELPILQKIHEKYDGKGVEIIGIHTDARVQDDKVKDMVRQLKLTFPQVVDYKAGIDQKYQIYSLPTLVVVDQVGRIVKRQEGLPRGDYEQELSKLIDGLLAGQKDSQKTSSGS